MTRRRSRDPFGLFPDWLIGGLMLAAFLVAAVSVLIEKLAN